MRIETLVSSTTPALSKVTKYVSLKCELKLDLDEVVVIEISHEVRLAEVRIETTASIATTPMKKVTKYVSLKCELKPDHLADTRTDLSRSTSR